ncbi:MAG: TonB-dependent receptor, partial [bacterium]|nr:TonB-dependent receptor [bacterium]
MKKYWLIFGLGIILMLGLSQAGLAQKVVELEEIVVTATKGEKKIKDSPAAVAIITSEDIEKYKINYADEALKIVSGCVTRRSKGL